MALSHWNYRLMVHEDGSVHVHEVYYDKRARVVGWTMDPVAAVNARLPRKPEVRDRVLRAFDRPILDRRTGR